MEDRLQTRQATVDELTAFIDGSHQQLDELLCHLQWDKEDILAQNEEKMKVCPIHSHHLVPETCLEQHTHECQLVAQGYSRQKQKEIPASHSFFYARSSSVVPVIIDKEAQDDILSQVPGSSRNKEVPRTIDRMDKAFTAAEKLAIHLAVLEKSKAARQQETVSLQDLEFDPEALLKKDEPAKPKSRLEVLAELRDYKRRRQSYRAKNVHITRRSQTEIMRDVIEAQMKELQQALQGDEGSVNNTEHRGRSSSPDGRRSRDASHSPIRSTSRKDNGQNEHYSKGHRSSNRSSYDYEPDHPIRRADVRSRDQSPSPGPSDSRYDRDRNRRHRSNERSESPHVKVEKVERMTSNESSHSPRLVESGRGEDSTSRSSTPHAMAGVSIKVEKESRSRSPSQSRRDEREHDDRSHRHSKHKHRHKHKHHSRDSR
ncbi:U11/U12 small nuclear ribonucleoprotein 48 kDa protein-like [Patiria miniata]|uniref:Uncharacterized protein n=1 Tax=Patiria miniata TaxID=46514 RepID=A0A913ZJI6_PATMI|nr:U11/U12 small nuclear ribonucleoprotein 48 kDa protein-like [Patiria miniata]XP_038051510.1 U11/U12 small nuclear ribonucleoprotein 48 kDa protein-like [Patiria miniata]XP_038051511.1 U11/U12 small nuclear ribonucleoprotein 48 kDa protein-like [Patiria miniata]